MRMSGALKSYDVKEHFDIIARAVLLKEIEASYSYMSDLRDLI